MFHVEPSSEVTPVMCPVCQAQNTSKGVEIPDHFLTREVFHIRECKHCLTWFTWPQPPKNEIGRYYQSPEYISHATQSGGILDRVYRIIRNFTLASKHRIIRSEKKSGSLLDIGCGTGHFLNRMQINGWDVQGIEPGEHAREAAKTQFNLKVGTEELLDSWPDNQFDVITMWHVLEHVHDPVARMKQVYRLLKPDGLALIALPNRDAFDAKFYKQHWAAWDVPRHLYHFNPQSFKNLASQAGFNVNTIIPMHFDAFYVSLLSEKYLHGRKKVLPALINGLRSNFKARNSGNYSSLIYLLTKRTL